ncbi:MAG: hypothetical protein GF398_03125 [Chitinivibrionales bacterium]|nr:hypothetical protein [Chitinivibrionales bacterium]
MKPEIVAGRIKARKQLLGKTAPGKVFRHYRSADIVKAWYTKNKRKYPLLSFRIMAQYLGFTSHAAILQLFTGRMKISPMILPKYIKLMKLKGEEAHYFTMVVALERLRLDFTAQKAILQTWRKRRKG